MGMTKVVEYRMLDRRAGEVPLVRFVLNAAGTVDVVPLVKGAETVWHQSGWGERIPGPDGRWLSTDDGELFLTYLGQNFRGSHVWATDVFEMEEAQARSGAGGPDLPGPG